jgi:predicted acylesterase/phospholipase RssA
VKKRIGFVFSGAASRIAQEMVLMRYLVQGEAFKSRSAGPLVPAVLAGNSSGALSAVALNAILASEGLVESKGRTGCFSWRDYEELIAELDNRDVYEAGGIIPGALQILRGGSILDTAPLRKLLRDTIAERVGFRVLGDLPVTTYLSVVERDTGRVCRLCSQDHPELPLVKVLTASTAIPIAFPSQKLMLPGSVETVACIDGGTGVDGIPVDALRNENCHTIYVIRPMKYDPAKTWNKPMPLSNFQIMVNALNTFMYVQEALLDNALFRATRYAKSRAYSYIPVLPHNYNLLDFESGREQIEATKAWAEKPESEPAQIPELPKF